jgi:hypothetical protein
MKKALLLFLGIFPLFSLAQVNVDTLSSARSGMCSCTLGDKVFFAGSDASQGTDTVDIYDNTAGTWSVHEMVTRKKKPICITLNNKAYFISDRGTYGNPVQDHIIDYYDGNTASWGTDTVPFALTDFENIPLDVDKQNNQNLIIFSGMPGSSGLQAAVISLNTNTHNWTYTLLVDSLKSDQFSVNGDEAMWATDGSLPTQFLVHFDLNTTAITFDTIPNNISYPHFYSAENKTFIYGGNIPFSAWTNNKFIVYDHTNDSFTVSNYLMGAAAVLRYGNKVLFGAQSAYAGMNVFNPGFCLIYDLGNDLATQRFMSKFRSSYGLTANCGSFYLGGGYHYSQFGPAVYCDTIDIIDTATYTRTTGELLLGRSNIRANAVAQNILFAGGSPTNSVNTDIVEIYNCLTVGENEQKVEESINLFPNPANNQIFLETPFADGRFSIINSIGQTVLSGQINATKQEINLAQYPDGVYLLRVESSNEKVVLKHIVIAH